MDKPQSYIEQLAEHIKKNIKKGYTIDSLRFSLISQGYSKLSVDNAITLAHKQLAEEIPHIKEKPHITYKIIDEDNTIELKQKKSFWEFLKELFS